MAHLKFPVLSLLFLLLFVCLFQCEIGLTVLSTINMVYQENAEEVL